MAEKHCIFSQSEHFRTKTISLKWVNRQKIFVLRQNVIDNLLSEKNSRLTFNDLKVVLKVYLESCQAFKVEFLPKIAAENK